MFFFKKKGSLVRRLVIAKSIGLFLGILGAVWWIGFMDQDWLFGLGMVLWGTLLGGMVGMIGVMERHPVFKFRMHPVLRGGMVGLFLELMLGLLNYPAVEAIYYSIDFLPEASMGMILFMMALEGFFWGMIIDVVATKYGGEGSKIL